MNISTHSYPETVAKIPKNTEFLLLYNDSYRSDNGYPEDGINTSYYMRIVAFPNAKSIQDYVTEQLTSAFYNRKPEDFRIVPYKPISIELKTEIKFV